MFESLRHLWRFWIKPIAPVDKTVASIGLYARYLSDWSRYKQLPGAEPIRFRDSYPCLEDRTATTSFDPHYFYQAVWATDRITQQKPGLHIDIGSDNRFVGLLTTRLPVTFVDIRPLKAKLPHLTCLSGDLLNLPFGANSIKSLSCLHTVEHVGLGRYGDPLNPAGTELACRELARVLARGGNLFFSTPVGKPRTCFNAHRVHSPQQVLEYFKGLELTEFSAVDDSSTLVTNVPPESMATAEYACGLFWFRRG